jgi:hypothetical protein
MLEYYNDLDSVHPDFVSWPEPKFGLFGTITFRYIKYIGFSPYRYVPVDTAQEAHDRLAMLRVNGTVDTPAFIPAPPSY